MEVSSSWLDHVGVAPEGTRIDHEGFTVWASTEPDLLLTQQQTPTLTTDPATGKPRATLLLFHQRQVGGETITTGGTLDVTLRLNAVPDPEQVEPLTSAWVRRAPADTAGTGEDETVHYRLAPLPTQDYQLHVMSDVGWGDASVEVDAGESPAQARIHWKLDAGAAAKWTEAIERWGTRYAPPGAIEVRYRYLRLLPEASADIHVDGRALYRKLGRQSDLTWSEIDEAWQDLHAAGDITLSFTDLTPEAEALEEPLREAMVQQALVELFDGLFRLRRPATAPLAYEMRWQRSSDAIDQDLTMEVVGWTWLTNRCEVSLADLVEPLNRDHIQHLQRETTFPASVTVHGHPLLESVSVAWSASEGTAPHSVVLGAEGGSETFMVSATDPDEVEVRYKAKVNFRPAAWPVIETGGAKRVADGGNRIVLNPGAWLASMQIYLYRREGDQVLPLQELDERDSVVVNTTYEGPHLPAPIKTSEQITPGTPLEIDLPRDPEGRPCQAFIGVYAVLGGRMMRVQDRSVDVEAGPVFLVFDEDGVEVITSETAITESDRAAHRLTSNGARPAVRHRRPGSQPGARDRRSP